MYFALKNLQISHTAKMLAALGVTVSYALLDRWLKPLTTDVSWLITVSEKMLAGKVLYVDILEVNPPASVFIYLPWVWLSSTLNIHPEFIVGLSVFVAALISALLARKIFLLSPENTHWLDGWATPALAVLVLLAYPGDTFAQREHIAVLALLPCLALLIVRIQGANVPAILAILAGIGAGIAVCIKPHFGVGIALPFLALMYVRRSLWSIFNLENIIAGAVCAVYLAIVISFFPIFISKMLPLVADTYLEDRRPLIGLIYYPAFWLWLSLTCVAFVFAEKHKNDPLVYLPLISAFGMAIIVAVQGKGWPYHTLPALMLGTIALLISTSAFTRQDQPVNIKLFNGLTVCILFGLGIVWFNMNVVSTLLHAPISQHLLKPRMIVVTDNIGIGHPLVRHLKGEWVGRLPSNWIAEAVSERLKNPDLPQDMRTRLEKYDAYDRQILREDIETQKPDVIITVVGTTNWEAWMLKDAAIAELMKSYDVKASVSAPKGDEKANIWVRRKE
jgi:hypothetical protein